MQMHAAEPEHSGKGARGLCAPRTRCTKWGPGMLLIELNEFNADLLKEVARRNALHNLSAMLSWPHTRTWTNDEYDSGFLEPWVQWVSVHTGLTSAQHRIKNLGDVPNLEKDLAWERWSRGGITSVIWGVMNGDRHGAELCEVFIPDPWTFSENAYPSAYQGLIDLPRYLAKNYLDFSKLTATRKGLRLAGTLLRQTNGGDFLDGLKVLRRGLAQFGASNAVFIVFFEYLSAMAFIHAVERYKPGAAIIFINMLAHVQHHYWKSLDGASCPQIDFAAGAVDEILGKLQSRCPEIGGGRIAVMNGLSQDCTSEEEPWILYRPNNHAKLMEFIGVNASRIEPLMTYDAHVFFASSDAAQRGMQRLQSAKLEGNALFFVERDARDACKVFYRVDFHDPVSNEAQFMYGNSTARFLDHFSAVVQRTGKHVQKGDLFTNFQVSENKIQNSMILDLLEQETSIFAPRMVNSGIAGPINWGNVRC